MLCFSCRAEITLGAGQSVGFRDTCDACQADLHVCLNCTHHDPSAYNECRESSAERVLDQDRANRCDYFRPLAVERPGVDGAVDERAEALDALENLFQKK